MSDQSDLNGVLRRFLTDDQADRLLAAPALDVDGDPGFAAVTSLFTALRRPMGTDESVGAQAALGLFTSALRECAATPVQPPRKPVRKKLLTGKALAALATASLLSGGAAAAATGALPDPVQSSVAKTLSHVGMDVPDPHREADNKDESPTTTVATTGDARVDVAPPSTSNNETDNGTVMGKREDTAAADDTGKTDKGNTGKPDNNGTQGDSGKADDTAKLDDKGEAENNGKSSTGRLDDTGKGDDKGKSDKGNSDQSGAR
jgi:hypothetical protein